MNPETLRRRYDRTNALGEEDPRWHCAACADDLHREHRNVWLDAFGEEHACCCPACV